MASDAEIVERVLAGDRSAFGTLVDRHRRAAERLALRIARVRADAEDVVQEAFLYAFLDLGELRARDRFVAWLLGIVVNLARHRLRARRETPIDDWAGGRAVEGFVWIDAEPPPDVRQETRELHDRVWMALGELPPEQQEAVQLHYVEGLRVWEIAALFGLPSGTVKARLHRARGRLRRLLAEELGSSAPAARREEKEMIEVTVEDVIVRVPKGGNVRWLGRGQGERPEGLRVFLLKEREGERVLPIWVGAPEGDMIALYLGGIVTPRPMSLTLMANVLELAGIPLERVVIHAIRDNIFYALLVLHIDGQRREADARPSDAVTLALHARAPIFVAPELFETRPVVTATGMLDQMEEYFRRDREQKQLGPEEPAMEYRSFRSIPVGS
jgi:RNA polymerase sigma factor (sigma-70 family)